jgi:hypothetical protein
LRSRHFVPVKTPWASVPYIRIPASNFVIKWI